MFGRVFQLQKSLLATRENVYPCSDIRPESQRWTFSIFILFLREGGGGEGEGELEGEGSGLERITERK
jgi:hypothetical protein